MIQGGGDTTVDWRYNLKIIREKFPAGQLFRVHAAMHHLVGEADAIRGQVFQAIDRYLEGGSLPDEFAAVLGSKEDAKDSGRSGP